MKYNHAMCDDENGSNGIIELYFANYIKNPKEVEQLTINIVQSTGDKISTILMMAKVNHIILMDKNV